MSLGFDEQLDNCSFTRLCCQIMRVPELFGIRLYHLLWCCPREDFQGLNFVRGNLRDDARLPDRDTLAPCRTSHVTTPWADTSASCPTLHYQPVFFTRERARLTVYHGVSLEIVSYFILIHRLFQRALRLMPGQNLVHRDLESFQRRLEKRCKVRW